MKKSIKILAIVIAMMALASCTQAQRDCLNGDAVGCGVASLGY